MIKFNKDKLCCKDVFNAFMVENASYSGQLEIPNIEKIIDIPQKVIPFSKINRQTDFDCWVHFFEHDYIIERIWKNHYRYIDQIKKFSGIIMPDFSLYRDMPLVHQLHNIYRSRAVGNWLTTQGIKCIPCIRAGDYRTFAVSCLGVPAGCTIAIGSHGTMKNRDDRIILESSIEYAISHIFPSSLVIYGSISDNIKQLCKHSNVNLVQFESEIALSHKKESEVK